VRLTQFTDYALRVLLFMGRQRGRTCTMGEVAAYYGISQEHLRKVVHKMAKLGYLDSTRGKGGGIVLGQDPSTIHIGDVILALEEDMNIVDCDAMNCVLFPECSLKDALNRGSKAFIAALNKVTLADLLGNLDMKRQFKIIDIARQHKTRNKEADT
jgi:Rrf2 family nitric oxide-sensitive transcriptional repressor